MTFWDFLAAVLTRIIDRFSERAFFGLIIVGAFVLAMGTLAHNSIPEGKNSELFGQGLVALIGAIGIIVGAIWKTSAGERQTQETLNRLVNESSPLTGDGTNNEQPRPAGTADSTCPQCGARTGHAASLEQPVATAPDAIPGF